MKTKHHSHESSNLSLIEGKLYSFSQLCDLLQISRQTVYNWIKEGVLTSRKIRGRVYFLGSDILATLEQSAQVVRSEDTSK